MLLGGIYSVIPLNLMSAGDLKPFFFVGKLSCLVSIDLNPEFL